MKIDAYERFFLILTGITLVIFFGAIGVSAMASAVSLSDPAGRVDPTNFADTPFENPGVRELAPGKYEVVMVAQAWQFTPNEIRVPVGSEVMFRVTSRDVIHGFEIAGVPLNMMVIPGHISAASTTFSTAGEYLIICHEYCGVGHQGMFAKIIVE